MTAPPSRAAELGRRIGPWLVAAAALTWVGATVRWRDFLAAFAGRSLAGYLALSTAILLSSCLFEAWGMRWTFRRFGAPLPLGELFAVRAATYVIGALQFALGQAALVGYLRARAQVPLARGAGVLLVVGMIHFYGLSLLAALGLALASPQLAWFRPAAFAVVVSIAGYLVFIRLRPSVVARRAALAPFFELGAAGHARALAVWAPYLGAQIAWYLVTLRWFGVAVPPAFALVAVPMVLVASALPLSVQGLGMTQVAAVFLFARYSPDGEPRILVCSLVLTTVTVVTQVGLGLLLLPTARRLGLPEAATSSSTSS